MKTARIGPIDRWVAAAGAAWYLFAYVGIALVRLRYPFELEWMEGAMVDHVRRVLAGRALYGPPTIEFVPFVYPPLYFYFGAAVRNCWVALFAAVQAHTRTGDRWALVAVVLLVLERIDGPIYAAASLGATVIAAPQTRRRELLRRVVAPALVIALGYHAWRVWYFGDLLTTPIYSKILYKFAGANHAVVNAPERPYGLALLDRYGFWPAALGVAALSVAAIRHREPRPYLIAAIGLGAYPSVVGDWMVGFRFFMPLLPFIAALIALAVSGVRNVLVTRILATGLVAWFGFVAVGFATEYDDLEYRDSWPRHPSFVRSRFFGPYYAFWQEARTVMQPGDRTALNQAGFIPFMLDLDNIDDLGICSKFFAKLPTTDVIFTEVGRFSPLTESGSLRAGDAYVLYREPRFVIARSDNLRVHNADTIPPVVLNGRYQLLFVDSNDEQVVYGRTHEPVDRFKTDPHAFLENVAHLTSVRGAWIDGRPLPSAEYERRLSMLIAQSTGVDLAETTTYDVQFADVDVPIYELHVEGIWSRLPAEVELALLSQGGRPTHHTLLDLPRGGLRAVHLQFASAVQANRLVVRLIPAVPGQGRIVITDLRVQGQTPALERYIARTLRFPCPDCNGTRSVASETRPR